MIKNKGFISMSLVYSFLIVFLFLMITVIESYTSKNDYMSALSEKVDGDIGVSKKNKNTLKQKIIMDNISNNGNGFNFNNISSNSNGKGLFYEKIDDIYTKKINFYFRGEVENNYVILGKEKKADGKFLCWRILNIIAGEGIYNPEKIKLVYSGVTNEDGHCTNENAYITLGTTSDFQYNISSNDNAYVGYKYGNAGNNNFDSTHYLGNNNSNALNKLEDWFLNSTTLKEVMDGGAKAFTNPGFCVDRSVASGTLAYGTNNATYGSRIRIDKKPSFYCDNEKDYYYYNNNNNGDEHQKIDYPIGLLTVDEVRYAGGAIDRANSAYFLNNNVDYWTLSPDSYDSSAGGAKVFYVKSDGSIDSTNVNNSTIKLRPVVTVKSGILVNFGKGTQQDPYNLDLINSLIE